MPVWRLLLLCDFSASTIGGASTTCTSIRSYSVLLIDWKTIKISKWQQVWVKKNLWSIIVISNQDDVSTSGVELNPRIQPLLRTLFYITLLATYSILDLLDLIMISGPSDPTQRKVIPSLTDISIGTYLSFLIISIIKHLINRSIHYLWIYFLSMPLTYFLDWYLYPLGTCIIIPRTWRPV